MDNYVNDDYITTSKKYTFDLKESLRKIFNKEYTTIKYNILHLAILSEQEDSNKIVLELTLYYPFMMKQPIILDNEIYYPMCLSLLKEKDIVWKKDDKYWNLQTFTETSTYPSKEMILSTFIGILRYGTTDMIKLLDDMTKNEFNKNIIEYLDLSHSYRRGLIKVITKNENNSSKIFDYLKF